jgi:ribosome maturation factor RimP
MTPAFLHRIRREMTITMTGLHEVIIAVSERVNRKVQIIKLHWQASTIDRDIEAIHQQVGGQLAAILATHDGSALDVHSPDVERRLSQANSRIRVLKGDLTQVESVIRELESENLRETLLKVQQDLFTRGAGLERLVVAQTSSAIGQSAGQLPLGNAQVMAILRGTILLAEPAQALVRAGDIVILIGPREDLNHAVELFTLRQAASA